MNHKLELLSENVYYLRKYFNIGTIIIEIAQQKVEWKCLSNWISRFLAGFFDTSTYT